MAIRPREEFLKAFPENHVTLHYLLDGIDSFIKKIRPKFDRLVTKSDISAFSDWLAELLADTPDLAPRDFATNLHPGIFPAIHLIKNKRRKELSARLVEGVNMLLTEPFWDLPASGRRHFSDLKQAESEAEFARICDRYAEKRDIVSCSFAEIMSQLSSLSAYLSARMIEKAIAADGPIPPDKFKWEGATYSKIPPIQWQLLKMMWGRDSATFQEVSDAVWGGHTADTTIKTTVSRLNDHLVDAGYPTSLATKVATVIWDN